MPGEFADDFLGSDDATRRTLERLRGRAPRDRQEQLAQRLENLARCVRCGSTWFAEVAFNQYEAEGYGAAPGADMILASTMRIPIKVCICGMPQSMNLGGAALGGRTPNASIMSFGQSLQTAVQYLASMVPPAPLPPPPPPTVPVEVVETAVQQAVNAVIQSGVFMTADTAQLLQARIDELTDALTAKPEKSAKR
jgi:hypothetical protein